jgi:hypothetical protein
VSALTPTRRVTALRTHHRVDAARLKEGRSTWLIAEVIAHSREFRPSKRNVIRGGLRLSPPLLTDVPQPPKENLGGGKIARQVHEQPRRLHTDAGTISSAVGTQQEANICREPIVVLQRANLCPA